MAKPHRRRHLHPGQRGHYHTCGLQTDGTLACWGDNDYGQASPPAAPSPRSARATVTPAGCRPTAPSPAGATTTMAKPTPPAGTFTQVSAGDYHTCGVQTDGTLACWGDNGYGQADTARGHLHPGQRGQLPHLRAADRRRPRLLGRQRLRASHTPAGTFTQVSAAATAHLRPAAPTALSPAGGQRLWASQPARGQLHPG